MANLYENTDYTSNAVLAGIDTGLFDCEKSILELEELAKTLDINCMASLIQKRSEIDKSFALGKGKLEELCEYINSYNANLVIFDHELSAVQLRNLEKFLDVEILDRTMLILEIFSNRAASAEGKLQVELAAHKYLLPRLSGLGKQLSRLGGGGGGAGAGARRGKGESKLELDRRHIHTRINSLQEKLYKLQARRERMHIKRKKDNITSVAIVGYTNVGKSTLLNYLANENILAENKLFATLDPTARNLQLPNGRNVLLIDTVGLIRRLPHHLIEAFKSTLEEACRADLLLNLCDVSDEDYEEQIHVTKLLLKELGAGEVPVIDVYNKIDKTDVLPQANENTAFISAKTGNGVDKLLRIIAKKLENTQKLMHLLIPYQDSALLSKIRQDGKIIKEEYGDNGTYIQALVDYKIVHLFSGYQTQ